MGNPNYVQIKPKTPVVDWTALWHIVLVSAAAGIGLAVAFGVILYGTEIVAVAKTEAGKLSGWILGIAATAFCLAAVGLGVYVMLHPKKSSPNKVVPKSSTALVISHHSRTA